MCPTPSIALAQTFMVENCSTIEFDVDNADYAGDII